MVTEDFHGDASQAEQDEGAERRVLNGPDDRLYATRGRHGLEKHASHGVAESMAHRLVGVHHGVTALQAQAHPAALALVDRPEHLEGHRAGDLVGQLAGLLGTVGLDRAQDRTRTQPGRRRRAAGDPARDYGPGPGGGTVVRQEPAGLVDVNTFQGGDDALGATPPLAIAQRVDSALTAVSG